MNICATVSRDLPADPDALFETLVNPHRLPEWNKAITTVIDGPETLAPGDEWVVEMAALAQRWQSRSQVKVLNCSTRRFEYTSQSDDGNPSYAIWSCESPRVSWRLDYLDPAPAGTGVSG